MASFYVTTPIYYASGEPHLGHAYTTILGDVIARYRRQSGDSVLFLTGTDEHGQKIQEAAGVQGMSPLELCDLMAGRFAAAWEELGISHDRFIRTTEPEHAGVVRALLERLRDNGHIYEAEYAGWYSVGQERYFTEKEIGPERVDPIAGGPVQRIREKNYFFRMSSFQERLIGQIEENPDWIVPSGRRNEVLGFLSQPLADLSISRPRSRIHWGVPIPWDRDQVTYVWVDALTNYVTASGAIDPDAPPARRGFGNPLPEGPPARWPADLHLIGKDILTTHAVYWPTLLMGSDLPLPRRILAHGWWVVDDAKMSKSIGNVVDPLELGRIYGADALRWYLMSEMATGHDASYTPERFLVRYNQLANILGNLAHRAISMVIRYRGGAVPDAPADRLAERREEALAGYHRGFERHRLHEAFGAAMGLARDANAFVEETEPWKLARESGSDAELDAVLATLVHTLAVLAAIFAPVVPQRAEELASRLGLPRIPAFAELPAVEVGGLPVAAKGPLFPRIETD